MIEIIPAIDLIGGKCVRLTEGDFQTKKVYAEDPVEVAKGFEDAGIGRLHVVDLDGARKGRVLQAKTLERIANNTQLHIDFGGGVRTTPDVMSALNAGAKQVTAGSVAVKAPELLEKWLDQFGPERIILGADARNGMIAVSGWEESSELELNGFIRKWTDRGIQTCISTEVSRDGKLQGPAFEMYQNLAQAFPGLEIIASGGVSRMQDILDLEKTGVKGVIVGKAIYENRISLKEITDYINQPHVD